MARAQATDFLHNMRFHVVVTGAAPANRDWLNTVGNTAKNDRTPAGFMSVTVPDVSVNPAMYKEGTWVYERKYPGETQMGGDIQLERGVARGDSSFWRWIRCVIEGDGEYRADLQINHYHREQALVRPFDDDKPNNKTTIALEAPSRIYHVYEAFPTSHNILAGGALSATDGEISIMAITCAYEHFEVEEKIAP